MNVDIKHLEVFWVKTLFLFWLVMLSKIHTHTHTHMEFGIDIHTTIFKKNSQQGRIAEQRELYSVFSNNLNRERI